MRLPCGHSTSRIGVGSSKRWLNPLVRSCWVLNGEIPCLILNPNFFRMVEKNTTFFYPRIFTFYIKHQIHQPPGADRTLKYQNLSRWSPRDVLVGGPGPPLWKIWLRPLGRYEIPFRFLGKCPKWLGMMKFPSYFWENAQLMATSHHQPVYLSPLHPHKIGSKWLVKNHQIQQVTVTIHPVMLWRAVV